MDVDETETSALEGRDQAAPEFGCGPAIQAAAATHNSGPHPSASGKTGGVEQDAELKEAKAEARARNAAARRRNAAEAPRMLGHGDESARFFTADADADAGASEPAPDPPQDDPTPAPDLPEDAPAGEEERSSGPEICANDKKIQCRERNASPDTFSHGDEEEEVPELEFCHPAAQCAHAVNTNSSPMPAARGTKEGVELGNDVAFEVIGEEESSFQKLGGGASANQFSHGDFQLVGNASDAELLDTAALSALERRAPRGDHVPEAVRRFSLHLTSSSESEGFEEEGPPARGARGSMSETHAVVAPPPERRASHRRQSLEGSHRRNAMSSLDLDVFTHELLCLGTATRGKDWLRSFKDLDPRYQILEFFNELSLEGVEGFVANGRSPRSALLIPKILRGFIKSGIFSVWRPTSSDAIRKMITGEGTGKGLDIKGKSAKRGVYSGFVPFLQIHDNEHKKKVGSMRKDKRVRVFYPNRSARDTAAKVLSMLGKSLCKVATTATDKLKAEEDLRTKLVQLTTTGPSVRTRRDHMFFVGDIDDALRDSDRCFMDDPTIYKIDDYAKTSGLHGLDIPEKLFWEGYVVPNDISREGECVTGRPSMPEFQMMNIETLRKGSDIADDIHSDVDAGPRPALWHAGCGRLGEDAPKFCNPMCPIGLLMAYEENSKVTPVVSDFDCFLLGTRGVKYHEPLGEQERSVLSWCVDAIEDVLETPKLGSNWTTRWLEVKKKHVDEGNQEQMPVFGFADPRSYAIMEGAVRKLKSNGAVRHGPECFNYCFPQELDEQYLVVSDQFTGIPWRYTNAEGLIDILCDKIDEGFTFPLNPKWILCDKGWRRAYDKLWASDRPNVQHSLSIWYPEEIRDRIDEISAKYPQGLVDTSISSDQSSGVRADLAQLELERYVVRKRSLRKLKNSVQKVNVVTEFVRILEEVRKKAADKANTTDTTTTVEPMERRRRSRKVKFTLWDSFVKHGLSGGASNLSEELLHPSRTITRSGVSTRRAFVDRLAESGKEQPQQHRCLQRSFTKHGYSRSASCPDESDKGHGHGAGKNRAPNARNLLNPFRHVRQLVQRGLSLNDSGNSHSDTGDPDKIGALEVGESTTL